MFLLLCICILPAGGYEPQRAKLALKDIFNYYLRAGWSILILETSLEPCILLCFGSRLDPDSIRSVGGSRRAKKTHKNRTKLRNFMFRSAGRSLLKAEGFSRTVDVLYGGLGLSKLQFLIKKESDLFSCTFPPSFCHQNPGSRLVFSLKCWIRVRTQWIRIRNTGILRRGSDYK